MTSYGHPTQMSVTSYEDSTPNLVTTYGHPIPNFETKGTTILKIKLEKRIRMKFFICFTMFTVILTSFYTLYIMSRQVFTL